MNIGTRKIEISTHSDGLLPEYWRQGSDLRRRERGVLVVILVSMGVQSEMGK